MSRIVLYTTWAGDVGVGGDERSDQRLMVSGAGQGVHGSSFYRSSTSEF